MGSVETKSVGTLFDELITTRLKLYLAGGEDEAVCNINEAHAATLLMELAGVSMMIFFALEKANKLGLAGDDVGVGKAYGKAQRLNSRRSALIAAIDERLGEGDISQTEKTF